MTVVDRRLAMLELVGAVPLSVAERLIGRADVHVLLGDGSLRAVGAGDAPRHVAVAHADSAARLTALERLDLIREIGARMIGADPLLLEPAVALMLSRALLEAGDVHPGLFERGARHALIIGEPEIARDLAGAAMAVDGSSTTTAHLLAMSLEARGRHGAAAAVSSGQAAADDSAWLGRWSSNLFVSTGIAAQTPGASDDDNEIVANKVWIDALDGDVRTVAESVGAVLNDPRSSAQAVVWACVGGSFPAALDGRSHAARRLLQHASSIAAFRDVDLTPFTDLQVGLASFLTDVRLGALTDAERTAAKVLESPPSPFVRAVWTAISGLSSRERGEYQEAIQRFETGLATFDHVPFGLGDWAVSELAVCRAMLGATPETMASVDASFGMFQSCLHRNNAWISAASGRLGDAQQHLQRSVGAAVDRGQVSHQALAIIDVARFGKLHVAEALIRSMPERDAPLIEVCAGGVSALASRAVEDLVHWHRRARQLGIEPFASELGSAALDASSGRPTDQARTELLIVVEAIRSPMLAERARRPRLITAREREVADLAGASLSSPEIAATLGISVRTVDNLLGRVYSKTGSSGRVELEAMYARPV